jgi:hypothetical protein
MRIRELVILRGVSVLAALTLVAAALPEAAEAQSRPRPIAECMEACQAGRAECGQACRGAFVDCMRGPRAERRACSQACDAAFEPDSVELEEGKRACRVEIVAPAREECHALRAECRPLCHPGGCPTLCRPGDDFEGPDVCRRACAGELHECAAAGKAELRECMAPCRQLADEAEREACAGECANGARLGAGACREAFGACIDVCAGSDGEGDENEEEEDENEQEEEDEPVEHE